MFAPSNAVLWGGRLTSSVSGHRNYAGENGQFGALLYYVLGKESKDVRLEVLDIRGQVIRQLNVDKKPGLHRVIWNLRGTRTQNRGQNRAQDNAFFARYDQNKDKVLTAEDAKGDNARAVTQILAAADDDRDKKVTPDELANFRSRSQRRNQVGTPVAAGSYLVRLTADGVKSTQEIRVEADPEFPAAMLLEELEAFEESDEEEDEQQTH